MSPLTKPDFIQDLRTRIGHLVYFLTLTVGLFISGTSQLNAQDSIECDELVCNGNLQISLNVACELRLTPDMLLEAPLLGEYTIELFDEEGDYLRDNFLLADDAGKTIKYQISCSGNSCWGAIIVEANVIPIFESPCELTADGSIPEDCILWCGPDGDVPSDIVTPDDVTSAFGSCGPELIGELKVTETRTGDICSPDGEVVDLVYSGKILQHGSLRTVDILTQRYTTKKLDVNSETFSFPENIILDCDYIQQIPRRLRPLNAELGDPNSILAFTRNPIFAYPYYEDVHNTVANLITVIDTTYEVVDQILRDTMVKEIVGGDELWVLKTIVDKIYEETYTERTIRDGRKNPIIPVEDRVCNVLSGFSDIEYDACGQGKKIVRSWNLIDWCNASTTLTGRQTIEIKDITAPVVVEQVNGRSVPVSMLSDVSVSIEPWSCSAKLKLPQLNIVDNCDRSPTVHWDSNEGVVQGDYIVDLWLGQSPITITGTVVDDCGNQTHVNFNAIIVDDVPPVPVCETSLQVSLTGNDSSYGAAVIYADAIDEGSHDTGCGKVTITVVRLEDWRDVVRDCQDNIVGYAPKTCTPLTADVDLGAPVFKNDCEATGENIGQVTVAGDFVSFCCEDLGKVVQVLMFVEDSNGNVNQCIVSILVVDQSAPTLLCEDRVISCTDGDALAPPAMLGSSCERESQREILLLSESKSNNVCAGGQTVREWYVDLDNSNDFSPGDAYCQQIVRVDAETSFSPYTIKWPKNYDGKQLSGINIEVDSDGDIVEVPKTISMGSPASCTPDNFVDDAPGNGASADGASAGLGVPVWCDTECGLIGYSMEADTIKASDACLKIIRRWTVLDWCTYNPNGTDIDDENDTSRDSFEPIEDWAQFEPDAVACPTYGPNSGDAVYFRYSDVERDGYYTYDQVIVVNDDTAPEIDGPATYVVNTTGGATTKDDVKDCVGEEVITATASDFCGGQMSGSDLLQWEITVSKRGNVVASKTARGPQASMSSQEGSPGDRHIITWRVKDGCGNATSAQTVVTFGDQQAPTPFCISGLTTAYMAGDGTVAVWAKEFNFGSFDNCTADTDLRFSLVPEGQSPIQPGQSGFEDQSGITFSCSDFVSFDRLDVWVWDENGNGDYCSVGIVLSDNGNRCPEEETPVEEEPVEEEPVEEEPVEEEPVEEEPVEEEPVEEEPVEEEPVEEEPVEEEPVEEEPVEEEPVEEEPVEEEPVEEEPVEEEPVEEEPVEEEPVEEEPVEEEPVEEEPVEEEPSADCPLDGATVTIINTIEGSFGPIGLPGLGEIEVAEVSGAISSTFSGADSELLYDITVGDGTIFMKALPEFEPPFAKLLESGTHDRYYISFDRDINITSATVLNESTSDIGDSRLTFGENQIIVDFGPGLRVGDGFDASISFEYECLEGSSGIMIAGSVQTSYGQMIDQVEMTVHAAALSEYPINNMTDGDGVYAFENNPLNYNYSITATKEDSYMSGISTLDLVMISRHILELETFDDPYKIIAADASADQRVSAVDLNELKRLVLGIKEDLSKTDPWIFINQDQIFFDEENPWPFTQIKEIDRLTSSMMTEDFIGVKIGDVNQSYMAAESRSIGSLAIQTNNKSVTKGQLVELDIRSSNFTAVSGYQFTLDHKDLIFKGIQSGLLDVDDTSVGVMDERLTMSWFEALAQTASSEDVLFTLSFEAEKDIVLSSALSLNSTVTATEAYVGSDYAKFDIQLEVLSGEGDFVLLQNHPNPFSSFTTIQFNLPSDDHVTLSIFDVNGKQIKTVEGIFNKGLNQIKVSAKDLNNNGLLYYQLESGLFSSTKRMVFLNN